jgi:hypothetical protein
MIPVTLLRQLRRRRLRAGALGRFVRAALKAGGARVVAWDDNAGARGGGKPGRASRLARMAMGAPEALVLSPGVPLTHPRPHEVVARAREARCRDHRRCRTVRARNPADPRKAGPRTRHRHHRHQRQIDHDRADRPYSCHGLRFRGGDRAAISANRCWTWRRRTAARSMCWKSPSYQIDLAPGLVPDVAVLTNITPDHIDRHGSMEGYVGGQGAPARTGRRPRRPDRDRRRRYLFGRHSHRLAARRRRSNPGFGGQGVGSRHFRGRRRALRRLGLARAARDGSFERGASARRAQLAECGARLCGDQALREGQRADRSRHREFPRPCAPHRRGGSHRQGAVHQ